MKVRIFRPAKTATQSGLANTRAWHIEVEQASPREIDPLMGWTSSADTRQQLALSFDNKEEAIAYARARDWDYEVQTPHERAVRPKSYADNFRSDRRF
jgi:hypothetical protein